jgi:transposase InsO family protein
LSKRSCAGTNASVKIVADRGELDAQEAEELFDRLGVKLSLTTAYNPEANGKVERGHEPIV